jgi:hypothetical protein
MELENCYFCFWNVLKKERQDKINRQDWDKDDYPE